MSEYIRLFSKIQTDFGNISYSAQMQKKDRVSENYTYLDNDSSLFTALSHVPFVHSIPHGPPYQTLLSE